MDYQALAICAGIAVYGYLEYKRREARHRTVMEYLWRGKEPPPPEPRKPEGWRLVTTGSVAMLLLAVVISLVGLGFQANRYGLPYYALALGFGLLLVVVALMFLRDYLARRTWKGG